MLKEFLKRTQEVLDDRERDVTGIGHEDDRRRQLDEACVDDAITTYNSRYCGEPLVPIQGKDSDSELVFFFENPNDAADLYAFVVDSKLLEAGEVMYREIEGQYSVAFMPHVIVQKPDVIQAALLAYEEQMEFEDEEAEEEFESLISQLTDVLTETKNTTAGAPKRKKGMGNPFHDKRTGKFSGVEQHAGDKGGSWSIGKTKLKYTGKGKNKQGGLLGKYGSTKHPCGRAARKKGKDIRCWDSTVKREDFMFSNGVQLAETIRRKSGGEKFSVADLALIMGLREKYDRG